MEHDFAIVKTPTYIVLWVGVGSRNEVEGYYNRNILNLLELSEFSDVREIILM